MDTRYVGVWIRQQRLLKDWSQEGLCRGVCAVSYLSKIEQGKVQASPEVLRCLMGKLGIEWLDSGDELQKISRLINRLYDGIFLAKGFGNEKERETEIRQLGESWETCRRTPFLLDGMLLRIWCKIDPEEERTRAALAQYENLMDERQHILFLDIEERYDDLLRLYPSPFSYLSVGLTEYENGSYSRAIEYLQRSYQLAAENGEVYLMLESRLYTGNCYSNLFDFPQMTAHYQIARRILESLHTEYAENVIQSIDYNIASTALEIGRTEEAYGYFSRLQEPSALSLHKLAVCCEKLGKKEEALSALDKAETAESCLETGIQKEMLELVRYRLTHPDYLQQPAYGERLLACFSEMRRCLPSGYAGFHLPWVLEWYTENRLYKDAYQLLLDFPTNQGKIAAKGKNPSIFS